ncbi:peptidoglycan DD-metalloendopeptidase family protein [Candidatus Hoaglandella endobia]|nr:peptidoglycan DD-metalloendopeptidase family protein [Candidatus Hoaglandella endobia]
MFYVGTVMLSAVCYSADNEYQLNVVQQHLFSKEKNLKQQQQQRISLIQKIKQQEEFLIHSTPALQDTQHTIKTLSLDINRITRSICQLQDLQITKKKLLAQQFNALFRPKKHFGMKKLIFINEQSMSIERMLAYFNYLNEACAKNIVYLHQTSNEFAVQKKAQLKKQKKQQTNKHKLQKKLIINHNILTNLHLSIVHNQQILVELNRKEKQLSHNIARAERETTTSSENNYKTIESKRVLISDIGRQDEQNLWPVRGRILHCFGELQQGELRYKGLVIAAPEGSDVIAVAAGLVLMVDWLQGYGLMVVIKHSKGYMSLYGYNKSTLVNVGDQVKSGQPIALVGISGCQGQGTPSLYFEIRRQGQAINPILWLKKLKR